MTAGVDVDVLVNSQAWPEALPRAEAICRLAVEAALSVVGVTAEYGEISVVLTDDDALRTLNRVWRARDAATNVLAFPAAVAGERAPPGEPLLLGDVVVAFQTAAAEAAQDNKPLEHHLSHLVVHGTMHLLGYDHQETRQAEAMERLEAAALAALSISNPYEPMDPEQR